MKRILLLLHTLVLLACFNSCIKDEPLNAECDITGIDATWVEAHKDILVGNPIITNTHVSFNIQKGTDRTQLAPRFNITEGARITMKVDGQDVDANGVSRDFSSPQEYTVHSQDGAWSKTYIVSFNYPTPIELLSFEHYELDPTGRYQVWYEVDPSDTQNPRRSYWASGNGGYAITGMGKKPELFPTYTEPLGVKGNAVKLETRSTGSFGKYANMPIAAGNLFIGNFNSDIAVKKPREATEFGFQLVGGKPLFLEGYYKYTAGKVFTDGKNNVIPERADTADIYAVVFEVDPNNFKALDGDNVLTSDRIVMMARIDNPGEPAEWTYFKEPFKLRPGKQFSEDQLSRDGYAIAVVCTSSRQGAYFEGAVGSVLYVDELRVIWEGNTDGQ